MERVKLKLTEQYSFSSIVSIRITDLNYGGHVGNDTFLSIIHEARQQFLNYHGYSELDFAGTSLIMIDAAIEFKKELKYGDVVEISVAATGFTKTGFDLHYLLTVQREHDSIIAAKAKTGMLCYNYTDKKVVEVPEDAIITFTAQP